MRAPGRNDPCPCGSGRKFKHCCGQGAEGETLPSADDRAQASALLGRLLGLPRFADDMDDAYLTVWDLTPEEMGDDPLADTAAGDLFLEWTWFDYIVHTGQVLAEFALEKHERDLTPGGRRFLRATLAAMVVEQLLEPERSARLVAVADRQANALTLPEVLETVITATWDAPDAPTQVLKSIQRVTRREALDAMMMLGGHANVTQEVRAVVLQRISRLGDQIQARADAADPVATAMYAQTREDIRRYLTNPTANAPRSSALPQPPGAPIGMRLP